MEIPSIENRINEIKRASSLVTASLGAGIITVIIGGVVAAGGGFLLWRLARQVPPQPA